MEEDKDEMKERKKGKMAGYKRKGVNTVQSTARKGRLKRDGEKKEQLDCSKTNSYHVNLTHMSDFHSTFRSLQHKDASVLEESFIFCLSVPL